tara:strand:- start:27 stop:857 length:831 start_codon:yes stop_codon:yes gene_type:complete
MEKNIAYPLEDGTESFFIDHGKDYSPFFTQQGHKTRFLIITNKDKVAGSIAGVWKRISFNKKTYNALYASDLKLIPKYRNRGVVKSFLWYLFIRWPFTKEFQGWDFIYFCAMQRENKGVDSTFKGLHLGKLTKPNCLLNIYILEPQELNSVDLDELLYRPEYEISLSPNLNSDILWNDGKKNIVSTRDGSVMKLGHLNPEAFHLNNKERLNKSIKEVSDKKDGKICFSVDCRNKKIINVLEKGGVHTDTKCRVFSFSPFSRPLNHAHAVSISTGEI